MENIFEDALKCVKENSPGLKYKVLSLKNDSLFTKFVELLHSLEYALPEGTDKSAILVFKKAIQEEYQYSTKKGENEDTNYVPMSPDIFLLLNKGDSLKSIHNLIKSVM
jgi:hypothetical protein